MTKKAKTPPTPRTPKPLQDTYTFGGWFGHYQGREVTFTKEHILELRKTWTFQDAWEEKNGTVTFPTGLQVQLKLHWPSRNGFVIPGQARVIMFLKDSWEESWLQTRANMTDSRRLMNLLWLESSPKLTKGALYDLGGKPLFFLGSQAGSVNTFLWNEMKLTVPVYAPLEPLKASE